MLELFTTSKYDNDILIKTENKIYTIKEIKSIISGKISVIDKLKKNVVILSGDNFSFIINFFASIYTEKNIFLITEKQKLKELSVDFDILDEDCSRKSENFNFPAIDIKKANINFYTSGSTTTPKCIKKSLYNLITEAKDAAEELKFQEKPLVVKSSTTMCHLFGTTFHFMFPICNGHIIDTKCVLYPEDVNEQNCLFVSTPAFLSALEKYNSKFKENPQYIITAGAKLDNKTFKYLEEYSQITEIYGSTETGIIAYRKHSSDNELTLFPNIKILENGKLKTEYGYEDEIEINDNIEIKGNKIKVTGRKDRILKIYEKRVSVETIENKLIKTNFVKQSYCFKYNDKLASICALTEQGKNFLIQNGIQQLKKILKIDIKEVSDVVPQKWRFCDELPISQTGKLNKSFIEYLFNVNFSFPVVLDTKKERNKVTYKLYFYKNCNFYEGHFPNYPITPGVTQLYLANELAKYSFNKSVTAGQIKKIKFSNIIFPESIINLVLQQTDKSIIFSYNKDDKIFSSGEFLIDNIFEGEK
ncbi:AMP-binding protein [bacterium]|nr:AMP-binding protein [bacterium]